MKRRSTTGEPPSSRYRVQAARKVLELLEALADGDRSKSLAELTAATGVPRATAFRLVRTLEEMGYVHKSGNGYSLGYKCFILGAAARDSVDLRTEALPHLEWLRDVTGETTQIAVLDEWQVVYLERVLSRQPVGYMKSRAGAILPAYCTGLGKAQLAFRPRELVGAWASMQTFPRLTPHTITTAASLIDELGRIRRRGYALDDEEREAGVRCIAAPVRDHDGEVVAAISVAGPSDRMPQELADSDMASHVLSAAANISRRLGYRGAPLDEALPAAAVGKS